MLEQCKYLRILTMRSKMFCRTFNPTLPLLLVCIFCATPSQSSNQHDTLPTSHLFTDKGTPIKTERGDSKSKEIFYFDVDHDFGDVHDFNVRRSDIPLTHQVSMLTSNNNTKREDLSDNIMSDVGETTEELDDSDEPDSDSTDIEAEHDLDYFNEGASSLEDDDDDDEESEDEDYDDENDSAGNRDEDADANNRRMQTSKYTSNTGSNRDQSADSWGSSSQGQDDASMGTSDSTGGSSSNSAGPSSSSNPSGSSGSTGGISSSSGPSNSLSGPSSSSSGPSSSSSSSTDSTGSSSTNPAGSTSSSTGNSGNSPSGSSSSSTGNFQLPGSSSSGTDGSMAGATDNLNSGPEFGPTTDDEEGMSDSGGDDDDDNEDDEESFDSEADDDENADPAENDGGDFDSSDDGSEDDLENEEDDEGDMVTDESDGTGYLYNADSDDDDAGDEVLDQDAQDEEGNDALDYGDDDDDDDDEETTPDARDFNEQGITGTDANGQQSLDQMQADGTQRGLFGGMKKLGRKVFKGAKKIGRKLFGGGRKKLNKHRFHKHGLKKMGKIKIKRPGFGRLRRKGGKHSHKIKIKMGKKVIRLPGRKVRYKARAPMKIALLKRWDWRRYIRGFKYEMIGKANIGFLVDGGIKKHLAMVQRWIANLIFLFQRGSYISVGSFGGSVNVLTEFKTFTAIKEVQTLLKGLKPNGGGRKIGEALEFYYPLFKAAKGKSGMKKSVLFLFATGKSTGDRRKMIEYGIKYKKINIVIFVFGLGSRVSISEFSRMTPRTRVISATNYRAVILGGMGLRLGYRAGMKKSIFLILGARLGRWLGMKVGVSSKFTLHHHGHSHKEWWFKKWDWYRYLGIRYGSLGRANLAFVIDGTNAELIMFIQRYVYNLIRLFQQQGTYVSIIEYGKNQYINTRWQSFTSAQAIQTQAASIPFIKTRSRNTAAALTKMLRMYRSWLARPNAPKIPNILFLIATGTSTDRLKFMAVGNLYRKLGITVWTFGIGPEGKKVANELRYLAKSPQYAVSGDMSSLVQKAAFTVVSGGLLKIVGAGNAMQYIVGNPAMVKIQMKWNWRVGMRSIRYGYLSRANIGILVDGVQPKNFGYIRRFVYNLIRMHSLSGTYVSLMVFGSKVYRVSNFVQLRTPLDVRSLVMKMPKVANGARRTGAALQAMLQGFGDAPPGNPNILYLIVQGPSADPVAAPAASLRKFGIKAFAAGFGPMASPKELATIAFSSSTIFKSGPNGLVHTLNNIQQAAVSITGTVSKACGKSGHTRCRKQDIVKQWQWKTYGISFSYSNVKKASVMFLIDGTNTHHFDVLQKLVYNIYKLFASGTSVSIMTYGGSIDTRLAMFRTFTDGTAFQTYLSAMTYKGGDGRKIGAALTGAIGPIGKAPAGKKILFLIATGPSDDDVTGPAKAMVNKGVSIFALGIGKEAKGAEMKKISRYFLTTRWKGLLTSMIKIQNSLIRVVGRVAKPAPDVGPQPDAPPGDPAKKPPLPVPTAGFIASSSAQPIGQLQTKWDWYKMMKIKPQGLNGANVIIMLDVSKSDSWDIMQRFLGQLFAMFKYKDTSFSLVTFSDSPQTSFQKKTFANFDEAKAAAKTIEPRVSKKVKTGKALMFVKKDLLPMLVTDKSKVGLLFLITRTKSSDDLSKGSEQIKGSGTKGIGIGIGPEISQEEISMIALNGQLGLSGPVTSLPAIMIRILFGLTTIVNGPPPTPIMSLTTMAGKNGPALAGDVMNSVQTGSVPSETAGQPGSSNTGATAGDAAGADTGGGSAGAPDQGGSTNPAGKPEVAPAAMPPAGGPEAGGGETGAGGTDVSAGGGAAGATEAATGQSKQDGGTGGPADGTVTSGESSKPTNPDGTPAASPVKPDGTPVAPTNPDGTPGTGPANPDGTPANPPTDTNPDGTPAKNPDGTPVEPAGGASPVNPANPAKPPDKTNPDGSTTADNPDGSKTTTKPDGSSTTTKPDGSATTTQPDGTTMNKKPDGTVTTTTPDGSTTTSKVPPDANPDGTPPGPGEKPGASTTNPDGSTTTTQPDGSTVEEKPDGSTSETKPDGSTTNTKPDGSATTKLPDGTTMEKQTDGTVTTTKPDGTISTGKVAPDANPDGSLPKPKPPAVQPTDDATAGAPTAPGEPTPNPDGSTTTTNPDGSTSIKKPDGATIETKPDGSKMETKPDGSTTTTQPDGSATTTKPDGTKMDKQPDGTVTTTKPDGQTSTSKVPPDSNPDGTPPEPVPPAAAPAEPPAPVTNPDGSTTTANPDGSAITKKPDGTTTETKPDGSATTTKPDGTKMDKQPDGTVTTTKADGSTSTSNVAPDANPDGSPTAAPPPPSAPAAPTAPVKNPDGSTTTANPDGSAITKKPDGTTTETKPDGSATTTKPDGTKMDKQPDGTVTTTKADGSTSTSNVAPDANPDGSPTAAPPPPSAPAAPTAPVKNPDGSTTTANPDGSAITKKPDGTTTETKPDGSATTTKPDGTKMDKQPDGTVTTTNPDGSTSTSNVAPDANPDGSPTAAPPPPSAPAAPTAPVKNPDGSTTAANPDGSAITKKPDGTTTETKPDGSATTTKPDGTKMDKQPDGTVTTTNPDGSTSTSNVAPDANPDGSPTAAPPPPSAPAAGGCACAGKCPEGCVPVMVTCQPKQKNCVHKQQPQVSQLSGGSAENSRSKQRTNLNSEESEINAVQKLLEEFYDDDTKESKKQSISKKEN